MIFNVKSKLKNANKKSKIEAIQYNVENLNDVMDFVGFGNALWNPTSEELWIRNYIGDCIVKNGWYVIKRKDVGLCVVQSLVFDKVYEKCEQYED